ncbi:MAG: VWA domain-containing protein [Terriglobales bacterium]
MRALGLVILSCALVGAAAAQSDGVPEVRSSSHAYTLAPLVISAATDRVAVDVVVRKPDGTLVAGLSQRDFQVFDDGHLRPLTGSLTVAGPGPLAPEPPKRPSVAASGEVRPVGEARSVALFFDDVNTGKGDLEHARNAAARFVSEALEPSDRVAIFTGSDRQSLGYTRDHAQLLATIAGLAVHPRHDRRFGTCPHITPYQAYQIVRLQGGLALQAAVAEKQACDVQNGIENNDGTEAYTHSNGIPGFDNQSFQVMAAAETIWDETRAASHDTLASIGDVVDDLGRQPGRRMLLLASDGFLSGTLGAMRDDIVQQALRSGVVINSLDARGLYSEGPGRDLNSVPDIAELPLPTYFYEESSHASEQMAQEDALADLAESTGGLFFHNNSDLTVGFRRLGLIPALTYELTFAPGDIAHDGKFRKIKVELTPRSKDIIQARPGYYAPAAAASDVQTTLDNAMRATASSEGLPATVAPQSEPGGTRINVHFDTARLPFQHEHGRRDLDLIFIVGLFNPQARFVVGKQATMDMALKDVTYKRLLGQGLNINLTLRAPAGPYSLRLVIADGANAHLFAATRSVTVQP